MNRIKIVAFLLCCISFSARAQSIGIAVKLDRIVIEDREFNFSPPVKLELKLKNEKPSAIVDLARADDDTFAARFIYHISFTVVSSPGKNPQWKKTGLLDVEFYKKEKAGNEWKWFYTAKELVPEKAG